VAADRAVTALVSVSKRFKLFDFINPRSSVNSTTTNEMADADVKQQ